MKSDSGNGMNKESLIAQVADRTGLAKAQAKSAVEEVFNAISDCLARGEKFQYIGFGAFFVKKRAARMGINPITKEKMKIKAKKIPSFSPGKKLSERVE
ncbi:MAG: HU family DNA-binding protein [Candidatus Eremiobacteraeota bacterium]|nr:HU family DNA-binding protein [Candidatus Eremiobacteraeota bacterium]